MRPDDELPDDLADIERALSLRARPVPPPDLRRRVLASVEREAGRGLNLWLVVAAAAAAVAIALRPPLARTGGTSSREALAWARAELHAQSEPFASAKLLDLAHAAERAQRVAKLAQVPLLAPVTNPGS